MGHSADWEIRIYLRRSLKSFLFQERFTCQADSKSETFASFDQLYCVERNLTSRAEKISEYHVRNNLWFFIDLFEIEDINDHC